MISIVLPVYNPTQGWAQNVLLKVHAICEMMPNERFEFIVVNDGSNNLHYTQEKKILNTIPVQLIEYSDNNGKGEAVRKGVKSSVGEIIVYTDIDFPYTLESLSHIIKQLKSHETDITIGIKSKGYYEHVPTVRRLISYIFRFFIKNLFQIPTDDTQCGLKGFNQSGKEIFLQTTISRYLFDLEFIFLASRQKNIKIKTQEIQLRRDVEFRRMHFGILRYEIWNFLKILKNSSKKKLNHAKTL